MAPSKRKVSNIYGKDPGCMANYELTWKRVENHIPEMMEDDSLIHLFTEKKKIKRRTRLLNAYIRPSMKCKVSYRQYVKAKTAALRAYSEDEDTTEDSDDEDKTIKNARRNTLQKFLREMMLDSDNSEEAHSDSDVKARRRSKPLKAETVSKTPKSEPVVNTKRKSRIKLVKEPPDEPKSTISKVPTSVFEENASVSPRKSISSADSAEKLAEEPAESQKPKGRHRESLVPPAPEEPITPKPEKEEKLGRTRSQTQTLMSKYLTQGSKSKTQSPELFSDEEDRANEKIITVMVESQPHSVNFGEDIRELTASNCEGDPLAPDMHVEEPITPKKDNSMENEIIDANSGCEHSFSEFDGKIEINTSIEEAETSQKDFSLYSEALELTELNLEEIAEEIIKESQFSLQNGDKITTDLQNWPKGGSDGEFYTSNSTDCDSNDVGVSKNSLGVQGQECQESVNNLEQLGEFLTQDTINDDMFEEEKVITQAEYRIGGHSQYRKDLINEHEAANWESDTDLKEVEDIILNVINRDILGQVHCQGRGDETARPESNIKESSENEENCHEEIYDRTEIGSPKQSRELASTECEINEPISPIREFNEINEPISQNIEPSVQSAIGNIDGEKEYNESVPRQEPSSLCPDEVESGNNISEIEVQEESATKKITVDTEKRSSYSSPNTAADVEKNLLAVLDSVFPEKSVPTISDPPSSCTDGENSRPSDVPSPPRDSGFDEDSEILPPKHFRQTESPKESKEISPPREIVQPPSEKKKTNLKIKSTEVVTAKYTIIRNNVSSTPTRVDNSTSPRDRANSETSDSGSEHCSRWGDESENEGSGFGMLRFRNQLTNDDSDEENVGARAHGEEVFEKNRNSASLVPTESETLQYVLNSLIAKEKYADSWKGGVAESLQNDVAGFNNGGESEPKSIGLESFRRPTTIPEFVDGKDFEVVNSLPVFNLTDITEDDDFYLLEVPKWVVEKNLKNQRFKLTKKKIILGQDRYNIQMKEGEPMSCVLHSGGRKNRYKTGIINPLKQIFIRQQVKDDIIKAPKVECEVEECVPFPKNLKVRNPMITNNDDLSVLKSRMRNHTLDVDDEENRILPSQSRDCHFDRREEMEVDDRLGCSEQLEGEVEECVNVNPSTTVEFPGRGVEDYCNDNIDEHEDLRTPKKHKKSKKNKKLDREAYSVCSDENLVDDGVEKDETPLDGDSNTSRKKKKKKKNKKSKEPPVEENLENTHDEVNTKVLCLNDESRDKKRKKKVRLVDDNLVNLENKKDTCDELITRHSAEEESENPCDIKAENNEERRVSKKHKKSKKLRSPNKNKHQYDEDSESLRVEKSLNNDEANIKGKKHRTIEKLVKSSHVEDDSELEPKKNRLKSKKEDSDTNVGKAPQSKRRRASKEKLENFPSPRRKSHAPSDVDHPDVKLKGHKKIHRERPNDVLENSSNCQDLAKHDTLEKTEDYTKKLGSYNLFRDSSPDGSDDKNTATKALNSKSELKRDCESLIVDLDDNLKMSEKNENRRASKKKIKDSISELSSERETNYSDTKIEEYSECEREESDEDLEKPRKSRKRRTLKKKVRNLALKRRTSRSSSNGDHPDDDSDDKEEKTAEKCTLENEKSIPCSTQNNFHAKIDKSEHNDDKSSHGNFGQAASHPEKAERPGKNKQVAILGVTKVKLGNVTLFGESTTEDEGDSFHQDDSPSVPKNKKSSIISPQIHDNPEDAEEETEKVQNRRSFDEHPENSSDEKKILTNYSLFNMVSSEDEDGQNYLSKSTGLSKTDEQPKVRTLHSQDSIMSVYQDHEIDIKHEIIDSFAEKEFPKVRMESECKKKKKRKRSIEDCESSTQQQSDFNVNNQTSLGPADEDFEIPEKRKKSKKKKKKSKMTSDDEKMSSNLIEPKVELDFKGKKRKQADSNASSISSSNCNEIQSEFNRINRMKAEEDESKKKEIKICKKSFFEQLMSDDD